jgi:hypothetical protein
MSKKKLAVAIFVVSSALVALLFASKATEPQAAEAAPATAAVTPVVDGGPAIVAEGEGDPKPMEAAATTAAATEAAATTNTQK